MTQIVEGGSFTFKVVAKNKFGTVVSSTDATVVATLGSATVDPTGDNGVLQTSPGQVGDGTLVGTVAGVESPPFPFSVVADQTVVSVEVVDTTVASVEVQPT